MGGPSSMGWPNPSITRPRRLGPTATRESSLRGQRVAELQAVGLFQRHRKDAPVAEPDYLGADTAARGGGDLAEIADGRTGSAGFDKEADYLLDLAAPAEGEDAVEFGDVGGKREARTHERLRGESPPAVPVTRSGGLPVRRGPTDCPAGVIPASGGSLPGLFRFPEAVSRWRRPDFRARSR